MNKKLDLRLECFIDRLFSFIGVVVKSLHIR